MVAVMNSGFFDYGYDTTGYFNWAYGKLVDLSYKKLGLDIIRNGAYPIAIQKANNKLFSDTSIRRPMLYPTELRAHVQQSWLAS